MGLPRRQPGPRASLGSAHELPAELPDGEHVLWQGNPGFWPMARSLHLRGVAAYLAVLFGWYVAVRLGRRPGALPDIARIGALASAAIAIIAAYAALVCANTSYTVTNRRLVLQSGIALPVSLNMPLSHIAALDLRRNGDGSGDLVVRIEGSGKGLGYAVLWPHARPWKLAKPEPMLRAVPGIDRAATLLGRLLDAPPIRPQAPAGEPIVSGSRQADALGGVAA